MSDEHFLTRWSRRKREAAEQPDKPAADEAAHDQAGAVTPAEASGTPAPPAADKPDKKAVPEVDLASLPPIESIGADTDIRAFLQAGVPADLTRAALRRVWTSDPTIRDFIGIAENQWDFAAADGVPGFGPLKAVDDVRRMVAEISNEVGKLGQADKQDAKSTVTEAAEPATESAESQAPDATGGEPAAQDVVQLPQDVSSETIGLQEPPHSIVRRNEIDIAMQYESKEEEYKPLPTRRPHGRALPE
jgi:hypothetical protein